MQLSKNRGDPLTQTDTAGMVGLTGFEPVTPRLSSVCSNQLSYRPAAANFSPFGGTAFGVERFMPLASVVEARGFEPLTSSLQSWRSTN